MHDRNDEALVVEIDRDAESDPPVQGQRVVARRRVEVREVVQRVDDGPRDERQVREREALFGAEPLTPLAARVIDGRVVGIDDGEGVGGGVLRREQRGAGAALHPVERHPLVALGHGHDRGIEIAQRDPAVGTRPGAPRERRRIDAPLGRDPAHRR